ncbi:MAG: putative nicotinamide N-methyase [Methylophilaceae bacterium]|jgi:predicted nicotinamide N-methyase
MTTPVRVKYQTIEIGSIDIHLCTLRDKQQFSDPDNIAKNLGINDTLWPLFGVVWPSSLVLAHYMDEYETDDKRILEIGCGMALTSLMLNKQHADITATDYHPEVAGFLQSNSELNHDADIQYERANWSEDTDTLGRFDVIIGSDILYEDEHIQQLANFIEQHSLPNCEVILVDPGRGRINKLGLQMKKHGYQSEQIKPINTDYLEMPFKGLVLKYWRTVK